MPGSVLQGILALPFSRRQKRLMKSRSPLSEGDFVDQVIAEGGDREAAIIVYRKLREWTYAEDFTPYPEDSLGQIYGIAEEELDEDLILDTLNGLRVTPPSKERVATFGPVDSPLRVAQLVSLARSDEAA